MNDEREAASAAESQTAGDPRDWTPEEAYGAYCKAANELHGEFANLG